ncbi:unnamed protein product [Zymoseptoria tritici ST99CH_3D1]|nr:unnamed protein product [Zymoseptoria tritici ST99CH_3D1]
MFPRRSYCNGLLVRRHKRHFESRQHSYIVGAAQSSTDLAWIRFDRDQFSNNTALDNDGNVQLFWKIGDDYSSYGIASRSNGYLALGFSETGAMTGADMALGYKADNGSFVFENRHAQGFVRPDVSPDQTVNMRFKEGDQSDNMTYFIFDKKNMADCLETQVDVMRDSWQWFIYAHSDSNTFSQHKEGQMGKQYVKLGTGKDISLNVVSTVGNAKNFTVIQPELTIPAKETSYCYTLHKMPAGKKNFLVGEQPGEAGSMLHHLVLYACYDLPDSYLDMLGKDANCDAQAVKNPCNGFVTEWAPGMAGRTFEPGFGKPFGEDLYQYAMLEVHYNNPDLIDGVKDTTGYSFSWTDQQVETEIGSLTTGALQGDGWFLDPGKELVTISRVCTPDCTRNWPEEGITAVAVFHHMHFRGVNTWVQIIRDGKEITPLSTLRHFEYGYQFSKTLNEIKLLPGDRLITTCQYNTMNDTQPVPGGPSSADEMCFAWIDYYPANSILACTEVDLSLIPSSPINGSAGFCLDYTKDDPIFSSASTLTADYEHLPPSGNNCSATDGGTATGPAILQTCPETDVCFSLNVPASSKTNLERRAEPGDIFFQLSAPTSYSWVALGQGTTMSNANIFVMYSSADGKNVTLSPRTATGHVMPTHDTAASISLLEGSGIANGKMIANVRCSNCKNTMALSGGDSDWIYAHLKGPSIASDDLETPVSQHDDHGAFKWDLSKATGGSSPNPFLAAGSSTTSSSSSSSQPSLRLVQAHGAMASLAFVGIFPIGAILVRLANLSHLAWVHGAIQLLGYAIFIAAAGIGISLAKQGSYLSKPHAGIGLFLLAVLFFMPIVGALQHRLYKKVHKRTVWSYGHIFTGRVAVVLGMINGGLGLKLADAPSRYKIVYGVFAGLMGLFYIGAMIFGERKSAKERKQAVALEKESSGSSTECRRSPTTLFATSCFMASTSIFFLAHPNCSVVRILPRSPTNNRFASRSPCSLLIRIYRRCSDVALRSPASWPVLSRVDEWSASASSITAVATLALIFLTTEEDMKLHLLTIAGLIILATPARATGVTHGDSCTRDELGQKRCEKDGGHVMLCSNKNACVKYPAQ